ncbi:MAG: hypothetical protein ACRDGR_05270, partial [bacterium]
MTTTAASRATRIEERPARNPGAPIVVEGLRPGDEAAWDAFVASRPDGSHYQLAGWAGVFERAFGQRPMYRVARRGREIVGVLPLVFFSN